MDDRAVDEKFVKMTTAPVRGLVLSLAVPTTAIMLISALYNMADTFFVGSLGTSATAGVGVSFPLMAIIQAMGFFFGQGAGNYVSRQLGAQQLDKASRMAATGFFSSLAAGALLTATGILGIGGLAKALGATDTILPYAKEYLFFILLAAPFMTGSLTLNSLLRFQGSAFYGMVGMISGAVANIVLDPIFIYYLGMGVGGAALATMISQFIGFCLLLAGCGRKGAIRIRVSDFSPMLPLYKEMARGGIPSLFRQGLASVATVCTNRLAGSYGDAAIAAMSIVTRVVMFANSAMLGLGQGFQPVCGFNYGAKRYDRVKEAFWFCVKFSVLGLMAFCALAWVFAPEVIAVFRADDAEVIRIGAFSLRLQFLAAPLMGWVIINNMLFQTTGKSLSASILAIARQGLFLLPLLFAMSRALGLLGIQISQPLADVVTFALSIPLHVRFMREMGSGKASAATDDLSLHVH
ncbi:MAG: MATE family efflux transporter [Synergistaceae bacterium]|jgi:putative MATE family efflux protein|nr:MATE family efflux transporter [Synergistaceae bacterium]